jgi:ubiquinone/menaquinone biosynthesis C-methylase UbiE
MADVKYSKKGVYAGRLKAASEMLQEARPKILLDIGCRDFGLQQKFYQYSDKVHIVDIDFDVLGEFNDKKKRFTTCGDACRLPYKDNTFDGVLCAEVIEHVPSAIEMLKECNRVLKKGGFLMITTPNRQRIVNYIRKVIGREYKLPYRVHAGPGGFHMREYKRKELGRDLEATGFRVRGWKSTFFGVSFSDKLPIGTIRHASKFLNYNATLAVMGVKEMDLEEIESDR